MPADPTAQEVVGPTGPAWESSDRRSPDEERLGARRHKHQFARLCVKHPIKTTVTASDLLGAGPIVRGIAACAGSVFRAGLIARCFFAAFTHLTAELPWMFGYRLSATFEGHAEGVTSLAALEGGRLASASLDWTIKIWDSGLADVLR